MNFSNAFFDGIFQNPTALDAKHCVSTEGIQIFTIMTHVC